MRHKRSILGNNPHVLYTIIILLAVIALAFVVAILLPLPERSFRTGEKLGKDELLCGVRRIAASSRGAGICGEKLELALMKRYCRKALSVVEKKLAAGSACDDYELRFAENHHLMSAAFEELKESSEGFAKLPGKGGVPAIYELLSFAVRSCGRLDEQSFSEIIAAYNSVRPLSWPEICALRPTLSYALLEQLTVYASKILKRRETAERASRDAAAGITDPQYMAFNSYVKVLRERAEGEFAARLAAECDVLGIEPDAALADDAKTLASYAGAVAELCDGLRADWFTPEYLLSLSVPAMRLEKDANINFAPLSVKTKLEYMDAIAREAARRRTTESDRAGQIAALSRVSGKDLAHFVVKPPSKPVTLALVRIAALLLAAAGGAGIALINPSPLFIAGGILSVPVFLTALYALADYIIGRPARPRIVPEMAVDTSAAPHTAIVCCRLIANADEVADAFERLEATAEANRGGCFSYGLLLDRPESYSSAETDIAAAFGKLRKKEKFFVCLRAEAWERKRGAVLQLNELLQGNAGAFSSVWGSVPQAGYVITLDADSFVMGAERLIGIMEHPYNADKTIMNIRMKPRISGLKTPFARFMCGSRGISHYDEPDGDVMWNVWGSGNFTGKGIYRVKKFNELLADAFPDGRILSHDFIEGAYSGCGNTGFCGTDDFPLRFSSYLERALRWMRGDMQLLPYTLRRVRDRGGNRTANRARSVDRFRIRRNIISAWTPVFSAALLALGAFGAYPLIVAAFAPQLTGMLLSLGIGLRGWKKIGAEWLRRLYSALTLPTVALASLGALLLTCVRMAAGRGLLTWKTYSPYGGRCLFAGNFAAGALFAVLGILNASPAMLAAAAVFLAALPLDALLSRTDAVRMPDEKLTDEFVETARVTWAYFEETLAGGRMLPCDNYQEGKGWADRTSPTNIGMALSSAVSACEIGLISEKRRDEIILGILRALDGLEKYRGCPYNWYCVSGAYPLEPRYVSSVDCGNLLASLLLVSAVGGDNAALAEKLIGGMDAGFLLDEKRGLLRIGYNVSSSSFDAGRYDLMGSEAMLTYLVLSACGKIPYACFAALSRRSLNCRGRRALASWSGGIFEYLLPLEYFAPPEHSLVMKSALAAVAAHRAFAVRHGSDVTAMSESLYGAYNDNGDYKYRAFGLRGLSLSTEPQRFVFAPYAEVMAVGLTREGSLSALLGKYRGKFGLFDSVDMHAGSVQTASMAHHNGMIMLAAANALGCGADRIIPRDPRCRAAAYLLEEDCDVLSHAKRREKPLRSGIAGTPAVRTAAGRTVLPQLNYIDGGAYRLVIDECGRNFQYCKNRLLTRFDDMSGLRVFVSCGGRTAEPAADGAVCRHGVGFSEYESTAFGCGVTVYASAVFGCNAEVRRVTVRNDTAGRIKLSVTAAAKPCLTTRDADLSHKMFSEMFVETSECAEGRGVRARRIGDTAPDGLVLFTHAPAEYYGDERYLRTGMGPRFGRTVNPLLACVAGVALEPGEKKEICFFMAYGSRSETDAATKMTETYDAGYSSLSLAVYAADRALPYYMRTLGAELMFARGRTDGAPPIVGVDADRAAADRAVSAIRYLRELKKFCPDFSLVIFVKEPVSYYMDLSDKIGAEAAAFGSGCRIINELTADPDEVAELRAQCVDAVRAVNRMMPPFRELPPRPRAGVSLRMPKIAYPLGIGGFTEDGEYVYSGETPVPWCNVMSDGAAGCVVSDTGGFTFGANSRQEKFTRHANDELHDAPGDGLLLGEGGVLWSVTRTAPLPGDRIVRHGFGYSAFSCGCNGIRAVQTVFVRGGVKYLLLELENAEKENRNIDVMCFAELVMGDHISRTRGGITCGKADGGIYAANGDLRFYLACDRPARSYAYFTESYRDRGGKYRAAADLENDGCTPALAYSVTLGLPPLGSTATVFALSPSPVSVTVDSARQALADTKRFYAGLPEITGGDGLIGCQFAWLLYQTYVARFTARCGYQQVGGAIGFRDQLQDAVALLGVAPDKVRAHIIDCASHQFESGDVMHWWHPPAVGVRTRICDDRLFLPLALCEYVEYTGDMSLLAEQAYYLKDRPMPGGRTVYAYMESSSEKDTVLAHAVLAVTSVKLSDRGLVLMGGGDWNDGMDKVGALGRGESVWCSMFMYYVIGRLLPYVSGGTAQRLRGTRTALLDAVEQCFDGDRYIRAFDDDGRAIGSADGDECRIDLLVQSWAVLSGIASPDRARTVLATAYDKLVDLRHGIIKLLDPPFIKSDVGYIADYPPGVRENGGQYTHAAVWFVWALYESGMTDKANELLEMLLPASHAADPESTAVYLKEPYVLAGDVYAGEMAGRGGWTWYTGAAGWLYRLIKEKYYGITVRRGGVKISPNLPFGRLVKLRVRTEGGAFELTIDSREKGKWKTFVGHRGYDGGSLPMKSLAGKSVVVRRQKAVD